MRTAEITGPASGQQGAGEQTDRGVVMVVFERGAAGRAALLHARALADGARGSLTVVALASRERTDVGCGSWRQGAWFRNELACEAATASLHEARQVLSADRPAVTVDFVLARGPFRRAIPDAVRDRGAEVIVLPAPGGGRLRRLFTRHRAAQLEGRVAASVLVAPATR